MTDKKKPTQWRFLWRDLAMGPMSAGTVTSATDAKAIYWICDRIHKGQIDCYPKVIDLLADSGCSGSPFHAATKKLVEAGWLGRLSGYVGKNTTYWLLLPEAVFSTLDNDDAAAYLAYVAAIDKKHGTANGRITPDIRTDHSLDQDLSLLNSGPMTPDIRTPTYEVTAEELPRELKPAGAEMGMELKEDQIQHGVGYASLPVATMKERAPWIGYWPTEDSILSIRIEDISDPRPRIILALLDVIGFAPGAVDIEMTATRGATKARINELLTNDALFAFTRLSAAGGLRKTALADWLACHEFAPLAKEASDAQAA